MYFQVFGSHEQMTEWVQNIARELGFVTVKNRTKSLFGQMNEINYRCTKGGKYEPKCSGKRKTKTCKTGCPFRLVTKYHRTQNYWILRVKDDTHNHDMLESLHGVPYAMRLQNDEVGLVDELTQYNVRPRNILSTIQGRNPDNESSLRTIYNTQDKLRRARVGNRTPIQVLYSHLRDSGYTWYPRVNEHTNELEELFFCAPHAICFMVYIPRNHADGLHVQYHKV